jgi:hypothetical protein
MHRACIIDAAKRRKGGAASEEEDEARLSGRGKETGDLVQREVDDGDQRERSTRIASALDILGEPDARGGRKARGLQQARRR